MATNSTTVDRRNFDEIREELNDVRGALVRLLDLLASLDAVQPLATIGEIVLPRLESFSSEQRKALLDGFTQLFQTFGLSDGDAA